MEEEEGDMGSLFEGMVLFTPSQLTDEQKQQQQQDDPDHSSAHESQSHFDASSTATTTIDDDDDDDDNNTPTLSQPLDENIFSDLTLVVSPLHTLTTQSDPIPTISRQISRKKKKAASLRIGYARHVSPVDLPSQLSPPPVPNPNLYLDDDITPLETPVPSIILPNGDASALGSSPTSVSDAIPPPPPSSKDVAELDATPTSIPDSKPSSSFIEDQFQHIKLQISEKIQRSRKSAASVSALRKDAIRRRRRAAEQLNSASANHRDLELQLEAACEAEDFEAAERISDSLASADKERQALLAALKDAEALCDSIDSDMHHVLDAQIVAEQECASLLSNFAKDAENNADLILKEARALSSKQMEEWFSSSEALEAKKMELDIESHFINEARLTVNDSIEHSIENYRKEQQILLSRKDVLSDELQKLLVLVRYKEKEIAENDKKIKAIEEMIADVVSGFQDSQSSVDAKYYNLQSELSQMQLQDEALSTKRKEIDNFLAEEEGHGAKIRELAKASEDEARAYQEVVEIKKSLTVSILKSKEDKVRLAKIEEKLIEDVQMLQEEIFSARASLQELSSTKSSIQQSIASFKQRIFFIDKRVPELEAEKKVAAAARNFKEAARIAAEAKSLIVEMDSVQIGLERATSDMVKLEEDIKNTISKLQDTEQLISSKEKEVAIARFQRLLLIAGSATAERSAALELGDTEEASLLLAEAEAVNAEARKLQPIYDLKEEEFSCLPRHFISMELVSNLGRKQLAELAESVNVSAVQ